MSIDNEDKDKTIQNSNKIITSLKEEYDILTKEYNDVETYVIDLEEENKSYKTLLDEITRSHDIHKSLILKNENFKNKHLEKNKIIEDLKNAISKKDLDFKKFTNELNDKNKIIEDFQQKFDEFEKLLETKELLLNTAEISNNELKSRLRAIEKENKELIKKLNDEIFNKKLDFEEIVKQSIEALKIFYSKLESNVENNINGDMYINIYDYSKNINQTQTNQLESNSNNNNFYFFNLDNSNKTNNKEIKNSSNWKSLKNAYNTVAFENNDFDIKSSIKKGERINRSLSPIGKKDILNQKVTMSNFSREKIGKAKTRKRSKSTIMEKFTKNVQNINFLNNDIFNFKEFFELLSNKLVNIDNNEKESNKNLNQKSNVINEINFSSSNVKNNFGRSVDKNNIYTTQKVNFNNTFDKNHEITENSSNCPLKIIIDQALLNPINYKIFQKNILRGNLQAFNFYYNFLKSELFSSLLRESFVANLIKDKLNPILKEYAEDENNISPLKNLKEYLNKMQKNLKESIAKTISDLRNRLNNELQKKTNLMHEIKNMHTENQKLNSQLEEVESNLKNLNDVYKKYFDKFLEKLQVCKKDKESLQGEIQILNEEINEAKIKHEKLLESFNDIKNRYSNAIGENEEISKELVDIKKRYQQKLENNSINNNNIYNNFSQGVYITTEENFSFKGNIKNENNFNEDIFVNENSNPDYNLNNFLNSNEINNNTKNNYNNNQLNSVKELQLMKENLCLKNEIKKLNIEKDNLKYHVSCLEKGLDKKNNNLIISNQGKKPFDDNSLLIRRASEVYYLPMISSNTFFQNRINTNTFEYTNNNSNNLLFSSLDYNNILIREDENNKRINALEIENTKLNNQITQLLEKNQALEYKNNKLLQKTIRFSERNLSIHNNIRFYLERSQEYAFKKHLLEKNEEVSLKYNIPTINYNGPTNESEENINDQTNKRTEKNDSNINLNLNYNYNNAKTTEEINICVLCKAQYQEVKSFRKVIKTSTYKELKAFYLNLNNDINKIATKLDNILENFNKTTACFESEFDISNANSNNFICPSNNPTYNNNNSSNFTSLNRTIKVSQVKEILNTFSKMISVLGNTMKKYQNQLTINSYNLEKIFEFVYRIVFSTLIYNEKVRSKMNESKSLKSNNSIKCKSSFAEENSCGAVKKNLGIKFEEYVNNFKRILSVFFCDNQNFDRDSNEKGSQEIFIFKSLYNNKPTEDLIEALKKNVEKILDEIQIYSQNNNNEDYLKTSSRNSGRKNPNRISSDNLMTFNSKVSRNNTGGNESISYVGIDNEKNKPFQGIF